jgi:hypothetical protein
MIRSVVTLLAIVLSCSGAYAADDETIRVGSMVEAVPSIPCPTLETLKHMQQLNEDVLESADRIPRVKIMLKFADEHCPQRSRINLFSNKPLNVYAVDDETHAICVSRTNEKDCQWIDVRNASPHLTDTPHLTDKE